MNVSPTAVSLPVTLHRAKLGDNLGIERQDQGQAFVDLRGPGATAFRGLRRETDVILRRGDGLSVRVPVAIDDASGEESDAQPRPDNVARLVIPSAEVKFDRPGKYEGDLPLGPGRSAPTVQLTVNVHEWWGLAIAAVLLGVLLGRVVPPLAKLERIRRKGRGAIAEAVGRYVKLRRRRSEAASFDLDALISPVRWERRNLFAQPRDEATRLLQEIQDGQDEDEVKAGVEAALSFRTRVERWARMEQSAGRLLDALVAARGSTRENAGPFADSDPYRDATRVLSALQAEPDGMADEGEEAEGTVGDLCILAERERKLLESVLQVWDMHAELEAESRGLSSRAHVKRRRWEVKKIWETQKPKSPRRRTGEDFMKLTTEFDIALRHLENLDSDFPAPLHSGSGFVAKLRRLVERTQNAAASSLRRAAGFSWNIVTAVGRGIVRVAAGWFSRLRGWTTVAEWFSIFLKLALPSLIYILTLYDDTWGSPNDLLTAFAAGFGGKVLIDLGVSGYHATTTPTPTPAASPDPAAPATPASS